MKCLNMKITDVVLFIMNIITICSINVPENKTLHKQTVNEEISTKKFDKCSQLLQIISNNQLTNYIANCKTSNMKTVGHEENVLEDVCIVLNVSNSICEKDANFDFLTQHNPLPFCLFGVSHFEKLNLKLTTYKLSKEFVEKNKCSKVCYLKRDAKDQCLVLSSFNNYFKNNTQPVPEERLPTLEVNKLPVKPESEETTIQKTQNDVVTKLEKKKQSEKSDTKEVRTNEEIKTTDKKYNKPEEGKLENPIITLTSKEKQNANKNTKILTVDEKLTVSENLSPGNEEPNEKDEFNEEMSSIDHTFVSKENIQDQAPNLITDETSENKIDSPLRGRESYSGEGFFQAEDSHFFFYFIVVSSVIVVGYLAFHNKNKILAYAIEGTNTRRSRRRPNPARYRKLETNLEEIMTSTNTSAASSNIVY